MDTPRERQARAFKFDGESVIRTRRKAGNYIRLGHLRNDITHARQGKDDTCRDRKPYKSPVNHPPVCPSLTAISWRRGSSRSRGRSSSRRRRPLCPKLPDDSPAALVSPVVDDQPPQSDDASDRGDQAGGDDAISSSPYDQGDAEEQRAADDEPEVRDSAPHHPATFPARRGRPIGRRTLRSSRTFAGVST